MSFSEDIIEAVWAKRRQHPSMNNRGYDVCDAEIDKAAYTDTGSKYGWEIDHIIPKSRGGSDRLDNLQPLYWENNREKGDRTQSEWRCRGAYN